MRFREKIIGFMQGRYGTDRLTVALVILYALIGFIRIFIRNRTAGYIITAIMTFVAVYAVFRIFSRNIYKRQQENAAFCRLTDKITPHLILFKDRIRDIRTKRYRRCPCCKNVLRLPYKRGKHNVKCPKCGKDFSVHIL
ncbi:MAG: hypothetical protein ACI4F5_05790 [Acutalibacteraceae bacterium]